VDFALLRELSLLTIKPFLYAFNADESVAHRRSPQGRVARRWVRARPTQCSSTPRIESELQELDEESAAELLESIGQTEKGPRRVWRGQAGFHTFEVADVSDCRPQGVAGPGTIHQGDTAPKAAGVIHTDFEKGFIKAEIVSFDDLLAAGSMGRGPRRRARSRMEGKDYVMADGDVGGVPLQTCSGKSAVPKR